MKHKWITQTCWKVMNTNNIMINNIIIKVMKGIFNKETTLIYDSKKVTIRQKNKEKKNK